MNENFVGDPIKPVQGTSDTSAMAAGEPGLPKRFIWRNQEYTVEKVLEKWKESHSCKAGSGEMYLRKHWFRVRTTDGCQMKIYFERQPRSKRQRKSRWWLYTITTSKTHN